MTDEQHIELLREALRKYADPNNWSESRDECGDHSGWINEFDGGIKFAWEIAEKALSFGD